MRSRIVRNQHIHLLEVNGETMPLYGYMSYQAAKACYGAFMDAGVKLFFLPVYAGDRGINQQTGIRPFRPGFWLGYGKYDFSAAAEDFARLIGEKKPGEIYVIPRLMVEPPSWWDAQNPGKLCRDAQGTPIHHAYCSKKWKQDTEVMMEAFRDWLEEAGWAEYVVGWHLACGNTEEFLRPHHHPMQFTDYSDCARTALQDWLKEKYASLETLNAAWHTEYAAWEEAELASPAQRLFSLKGALRDPDLERQCIDSYRFVNEVNAQAVVDLCAAAKRVTGGQLVIGAFFGYIGMDADIGHVAANLVYESEAVDFLASPFTYTDNRAQGVDWTFPGCVASSILHDKPWFVEADVRTCLSRPISEAMPFADPVVNRAYDGPVWTGPDTVEGSLGQMARALARVMTHNTAIWWFDMWGGWYDIPEFMDFHRKAAEIYREYAMAGGSPCAAPVAVFYDDTIAYETTPGSGVSSRIGGELRKNLGSIGTPYRQFTFQDFERVDADDYRVAIFPAVRQWSQTQLEALERWKKDGRVLVFLGPVDSTIASGVQCVAGEGVEILPAEVGRADALTMPVIRLDAKASDAVLRRAEDGGAVELMRPSARCSIYVSTELALSVSMLRKLVCAAAGQVYSFENNVVYASEKHLAVHAARDGMMRICYPCKAVLKDILTEEVYPGNESWVDVNMKKGQTIFAELIRQ